MRRSARGGHPARFFTTISLILAACGSDGGDGKDTSGNPATGDGDGDGDDGNPENCGKGEYPTDGELTLCAQAGNGCDAIEDARGYTSFYGNVNVRGVSSLEPLHCMQKAGGLSISNGDELKDLTGLGSLSQLLNLNLVDNAGLKSLAGLDSLKQLEILSLIDNGLASMPGLPSGLSVKNLDIEYHEQLTSLEGLENIEVTETVFISDNPKLPQCAAEAYAATLSGVEATIEKNDLAATCD
jgi:hypothetical protein